MMIEFKSVSKWYEMVQKLQILQPKLGLIRLTMKIFSTFHYWNWWAVQSKNNSMKNHCKTWLFENIWTQESPLNNDNFQDDIEDRGQT